MATKISTGDLYRWAGTIVKVIGYELYAQRFEWEDGEVIGTLEYDENIDCFDILEGCHISVQPEELGEKFNGSIVKEYICQKHKTPLVDTDGTIRCLRCAE